jgi:Fe2+ or Zn2+ uptake regulation protein
MGAEERLREKLGDRGLRLTPQRQLVMEVLRQSGEHLDAEAVHDRVKARNPNVGLATIYRALAVFKEMGLVEEHRLGENHAHFEAVQSKRHYHFTCLACGRVIEFDAPNVRQLVHELSERENLQVTNVHLFLSGYCAECQAKS